MLNTELLLHLFSLLLVAWDLSHLASLLSEKLHQSYNQTILWPEFSLLKSFIICLRGARSSCSRPQPAASDISLAVSEAKL